MDPNSNQVPPGGIAPNQQLPAQQNNWPPVNSAPLQQPKPKKSLKNLPFLALLGIALVLLVAFVIASLVFFF